MHARHRQQEDKSRERARRSLLGTAIVAVAALAMGALALGTPANASHGEGEVPCPEDLRLSGLRAPVVLVNWTHAEGSDATNIYRWTGDGPEEFVASVPSDEPDAHGDDDLEGGAEYTYEARAVFGEHESEDCPQETVFVHKFPGAPGVICPNPIDLMATPHDDGSITLRAQDLDREADLERRIAGTEEWLFIAEMDWDNKTHRDHTTVPDNTYEYRLVIHSVQGENECDRTEVTAIPVFPGALAALAALGAGLVGYTVLGRRG